MSLPVMTAFLYTIYTLYTIYVVCVSDYPIAYSLISLFVIWGIFLSFYTGYKTNKTKNIIIDGTDNSFAGSNSIVFSNIAEWGAIKCFVANVFGWVCSLMAVRFYTGKNFAQVINSLMQGNSLYYEYQKYFNESNVSTFSLIKIPYILMMVYCTTMLIWGTIALFLVAKKKRWFHYLFCASNFLAYIFFGLSRGTNFEFFICFVLVIYILLRKTSGKNKKVFKKIIYVGVLGLLFISIFRVVIMERGVEFNTYISPELTYNPKSFLAKTFPLLSNIVISVFNYLGFGMYTIGASLTEISFSSLANLLATLFPFGFVVAEGISFSECMREMIDIGVRWVPDFYSLVDILGLPLLFIVVGACGRVVARRKFKSNLLNELIFFFVFVELLSIPVGNFLIASSFNMLTTLVVVFYTLTGRIKIRWK